MKKKLLFLLLLMAGITAGAQPTWQWGYEAGGAGNDLGYSISTDAVGTSYVTGRFHATSSFGSNSVTSYGGPDIFIAKYNSLGTCIWARHAGSIDSQDPYGDEGDGIDIDASGNCFVTGNFKGQATFGSTVIGGPSSTSRNIFLAKYDASGNLLWVDCPVSSGSNNYSRSVSVDTAGNAYITGYLGGGTNTFGSFTLSGAGGYIVKYDASGTVVYALKLGVNGALDLYDIDVDAAGCAYVTGYLQTSETINSQTYSSTGMRDAVLIKADASGNFLWLEQSTGFANTMCMPHSLCSDGGDGIYLCGEFDNTTIFGNDTLQVNQFSSEIFIVKYDTAGNVVWTIQSEGGTMSSNYNALAITSNYNARIVVTGYFGNDLIIGGDTLFNNSFGTNTYVLVFDDSTGSNVFGIASTGQNPGAYGHGISTDNNDGVYICGFDKAPVVFGAFTTTFIGGEDFFIAKIGMEKPSDVSGPDQSSSAQVYFSSSDQNLHVVMSGESFGRESRFVLYDVTGREIVQAEIAQGETVVPMPELAVGVYCWRIEGQKSSCGKILAGE